jgi:acetylornithine deacetylase
VLQTPTLRAIERQVTDRVAARRRDLTDLAASLIGFDTTATLRGEGGGGEPALQALLAQRLRGAGFAVELFAPRADELPPSPMLPAGLDLVGRPQLVATRHGAGGGRDLLLNGHVDVVSAEPRSAWAGDPFVARVEGDRLVGRGACDMKGGVAAMILAAEVLAELDVPLRGDLIVNTVTDEESTGAGALACIARGLRADGCLVPEPTSGQVWLGSRGALLGELEVHGRPGHTGLARGDALAGSGIGAIERTFPLLAALRELCEEWWRGCGPGESPGWIVPTSITAGEWVVTFPEHCRVGLHVTFSPQQADEDGWSAPVRREIEARVRAAADADPWLAGRPPVLRWSTEVPAAVVGEEDPVVTTALEAAAALGRPAGVAPRTTWLDAATFTRAGTPAIGIGPGDIEVAHTVGEWVEVDALVRSAQHLAVSAMRFCGVDGERPPATR